MIIVFYYVVFLSYPISVKFVGDDYYSSVSKSFTAVIIDTKPIITAKALTIKYGSKTPFVVKATDSSGNPLEGKKISMEFWGANTWEYYYVDDTPTGKDGTVIIYLNRFIPDTYEVVISHTGVKDVVSKVVVKKLTPKLTAYNKAFKVKTKTKKFSVILKTDKGKAMKNVKLTIKVKGKTYSAKTSSNGKATFKITKLNARGGFTALVKFAGSRYYAAVSKKVKITVKK